MSLSKKDWEGVARFQQLLEGKLNSDALGIAKDMERLKTFRGMKSKHGLKREEKRVAEHERRILTAVWKEESDFLTDLSKVVEHFKSGGGLPLGTPSIK